MEKQCITCGKIFYKSPSHSLAYWNVKKYCSRICSGTLLVKGQKKTENWYKSQSLKIGIKKSDEFRAKMREIKKGTRPSSECEAKRKEAYARHEWNEDERRKKISDNLKQQYLSGKRKNPLPEIPWNTGLKMPEISGDKHPMWKGGIQKCGNGYLEMLMPEHPSSDSRGRIGQHRVILEKKIGRYLTKDEVAHHINGIKNDNRPENLMVMTVSEHHSFHNTKLPSNKVNG